MTADSVSGNDRYLCWPMTAKKHSTENVSNSIYVRAFCTSSSDLDFDFEHPNRPTLITRLLLASCVQSNGGKYTEKCIWQWSLKRRLQALLAIVVATRGPEMQIRTYCTESDCKELFELNLKLTDFKDPEDVESLSYEAPDKTKLQLRLPTGYDQLSWLNKNGTNTDSWEVTMATSLVTHVNGEAPGSGWHLPKDWVDGLGVVFEKYDRLMDLKLTTDCPACGANLNIELDLEFQLLELLAGEQRRLYEQIHRLASSYHWSEDHILALTPLRREYYLARISEELTA